MKPGQQLVVVTDGIIEAVGEEGRFGERRLRAELDGVASPAIATQKLEGALHAFTAGRLEDDAAIIAVAPGPRGARAGRRPRIASWSSGFSRVSTGAMPRRSRRSATQAWSSSRSAPPRRWAAPPPTSARTACTTTSRDVEQVWEDLRIAPKLVERRGDVLLVRGRVYARSRELGIRDMPVAWIWDVADGHFVRGEVFIDPEQAVLRLAGGLSR